MLTGTLANLLAALLRLTSGSTIHRGLVPVSISCLCGNKHPINLGQPTSLSFNRFRRLATTAAAYLSAIGPKGFFAERMEELL
jgi:hypothetical protein